MSQTVPEIEQTRENRFREVNNGIRGADKTSHQWKSLDPTTTE